MNRMKQLIILILFCIGSISTGIGETYTLEQYLELVDSNNVTVQLSRKDSESAKETQKQALSALLPTIAAAGGYTRNLNDVLQSTAVAASSNVYNGVYPLIYQNVDSNYDNEITAALSVTWNLIDPVALARYEQSKKGTQIQNTTTEYVRQQVLTGAKKLYAQVQLLQSVRDVQKEVASTSEEVYRDTQKKYNAGTVTEVSLRMADVDWKTDISAVSEAEKNVRVAMMALKNLAGIPLTSTVILSDESAFIPELPEKAALSDVLSSRLDYQVSLMAKDIAALTFRAATASFIPTVSSSFTYAYGQYGGYSGKDDWDAYDYTAASVGLKVTIPLFTGGARLSAVKSAKINEEQSDLQLKQSRDTIEQNLVSLELELDEAWKQIDSAKALVSATSQALEITRAAFENGIDTQLELSKAMSQYAGAEVSLQNAIYTYRAAYYDYGFACGKIDI